MDKLEKQIIALRYWLLGHEYFKAIKALELASGFHSGVRRDGSRELSHQVSIAHYVKTIIKSVDQPEDTLIVALLHDSIEDAKITHSEAARIFGREIANSIEYLSKFDKSGQKHTDAFYYMYIQTDRVASLIKGADRIHNLDTMQGAFTAQKKEVYLAETQAYVLPMLKAARREFPTQEMAYQNMKYFIESQIRMLQAIQF